MASVKQLRKAENELRDAAAEAEGRERQLLEEAARAVEDAAATLERLAFERTQ